MILVFKQKMMISIRNYTFRYKFVDAVNSFLNDRVILIINSETPSCNFSNVFFVIKVTTYYINLFAKTN